MICGTVPKIFFFSFLHGEKSRRFQVFDTPAPITIRLRLVYEAFALCCVWFRGVKAVIRLITPRVQIDAWASTCLGGQ